MKEEKEEMKEKTNRGKGYIGYTMDEEK